VEPTDKVSNLINYLTNDEDLRQELWVHYLTGNSVDSFSKHLNKIQVEYSEDEQLKASVWDLINNPPSNELQNILNHFTDFERSIICLLMLGLTVDNISLVRGISQVRIRQSISSIRYNKAWSDRYGENLQKMSSNKKSGKLSKR
jgi:hypothetical protein